MAINFTDFSDPNKWAQNKYQGISELLPNILEGYKASRAPEIMQTDLDLKKAQMMKALADAESAQSGGNLQGLAREWSDALKLEERLGPNHPTVIGLKRDLQNRAKSAEILQNQRSLYTRLKPHSELTPDEKAHIASQWRGLGIDPQRGLELYSQGISPENVAEQRMQQAIMQSQNGGQNNQQGMGQNYGNQQPQAPQQNMQGQNIAPNTVAPPIVPFMTGSNTTDYNQLQANRAESSYLGGWVTEHNAPYAQFPTAKDAWVSLTKRNDPAAMRERHEFLAAQMMGPETALLNIKLAQGSNADRAIKDVEDRLKLNAKTAGITMTPEDYRAATRIMHEVLENAAKYRGQALSGQIQPEQISSAVTNAQQQTNNQNTNSNDPANIRKNLRGKK